ncbi:MAG: calcium/sodium antiporter [Rikenellaceae bacterium]|nr:calcium/sodium antiporter [Rikenellaceae bacterium]MCL2692138.1 calcium/sodium antiporter [Rikenellaceae bacterium]
MTAILLTIAGLTLILVAAYYFTESASSLAKRFGISEFIIGMTVVALGTSAPELMITSLSAIRGAGDIAVGNIVGSNMFNLLFILGVSALILPLPLTRKNRLEDIPFLILSSVVLLLVATLPLGSDVHRISRGEGILMLGFFAFFLYYTIRSGRHKETMAEKREKVAARRKSIWLTLLMLVGGLAALVFGANIFVDGSVDIARKLGMSEAAIAVTLIAAGTSFPELAINVVSVLKKKPSMALGNIIGSNTFNVFAVLGTGATIRPLTMTDIIPGDLMFMVVTGVLLFLSAFVFRRSALNRTEGAIFILLYIVYIWWLLAR